LLTPKALKVLYMDTNRRHKMKEQHLGAYTTYCKHVDLATPHVFIICSHAEPFIRLSENKEPTNIQQGHDILCKLGLYWYLQRLHDVFTSILDD
jgi:hypothetical protein